jgi:hypothetical protein
MAMPAIQNAVMSSVAPANLGKASGTFNMLRQLGGAFGIAVLVAVFSASGGYASPQLFSDGFSAALAASAGLSLLGAVSAFGLPGRVPDVASVPAPSVAPRNFGDLGDVYET